MPETINFNLDNCFSVGCHKFHNVIDERFASGKFFWIVDARLFLTSHFVSLKQEMQDASVHLRVNADIVNQLVLDCTLLFICIIKT